MRDRAGAGLELAVALTQSLFAGYVYNSLKSERCDRKIFPAPLTKAPET